MARFKLKSNFFRRLAKVLKIIFRFIPNLQGIISQYLTSKCCLEIEIRFIMSADMNCENPHVFIGPPCATPHFPNRHFVSQCFMLYCTHRRGTNILPPQRFSEPPPHFQYLGFQGPPGEQILPCTPSEQKMAPPKATLSGRRTGGTGGPPPLQ